MIRCLLLTALVALASPQASLAHSEFQRGFYDAYTKGPGVNNDFRKLARKAKCNLCHQGKEDRTRYNRYGDAMLELLTEDDKKDKKKIAQALATVAELPSDGPESPTYGELITAGQLPGGSLEDSKREPDSTSDDAEE